MSFYFGFVLVLIARVSAA